jgi:hypothetical protein
MRFNFIIPNLLVVIASVQLTAATAPDSYAPLWLYNGAWHVTPAGAPAGVKPDTLVNECTRIGKYFGCQQTVNGTVSALVIFIPTDKPGHYYNQSILPTGRATGLGELDIDGDHWVYGMGRLENGKTMHYRTLNTFTGKTRTEKNGRQPPLVMRLSCRQGRPNEFKLRRTGSAGRRHGLIGLWAGIRWAGTRA